jgi:hypothetical protein
MPHPQVLVTDIADRCISYLLISQSGTEPRRLRELLAVEFGQFCKLENQQFTWNQWVEGDRIPSPASY